MNEGIVDFHTHAFPDALAVRAIRTLEEEGGIKAHLDGKVSSLLLSMDKHGIEKSVVCSIATKPSQFDSILKWCKEIQSERIIPFPSFHPGDPDYRERISEIKGEGFKGIKFHPYYQDFALNEGRLFPVYDEICKKNLVVVVHTGFDIAFPRIQKADPFKIVEIKKRFPELKLVTTHLGSWEQWKEVEDMLLGKPIFMEISCSLESLDRDRARRIILDHPREYVLFGTDSPWTGQGETLAHFRSLDLGADRESCILRKNAVNLLDSV